MLRVLWNGRSGLQANQDKMNIISNNISNIDTNGYKSMDVDFQDIVYDKLDKLNLPVTSNTNPTIVGSGSKAESDVINANEGSVVETGKELDVAINGPGYFRLKGENGSYYYTRDSVFHYDANNNIVNSSGKILDIENFKPANIKSPVKITDNGVVFSSDGKEVGKINLYDFKNRDGLLSQGDNTFSTNGENPAAVNSSLKQGYVEKSNVDLTKELTDMLVTQRAFQLNSKTIQTADTMWQIANNLRGR